MGSNMPNRFNQSHGIFSSTCDNTEQTPVRLLLPWTHRCANVLLGLLHVHTTIGLDLLASIGGIVSCLFLVGACSGFFSLGWALINCQLFSGVLLEVVTCDEADRLSECPSLLTR